MRRREFIGLVGGGAAWPLLAQAQGAPLRIGFLFAGYDGSPLTRAQVAEINQGMRDNGLTEGRDYLLELRFAAGRYDRLPAMALELAQAGVKMILANTAAAIRAAQALNPPLPVVMVAINDPVGARLIEGLARPGGNTTGIATLIQDLTPKMLEFQRMIVPGAKKLGIITNPGNPTNPPMTSNLGAPAGAMGMTAHSVEVKAPDDLEAAFAALVAAKPDALHLIADGANLDLGDRISAFAIAQRIPFFATYPPIADLGGLLGYGPARKPMVVRAGYYVKRILDGANPADLPVEQPIQIELWINLKTAKALNIQMPFQLEQVADRVVE